MARDDERFYFAHQWPGMTIGGYEIGARTLVRRLRQCGQDYPSATLVIVRSEGVIGGDDPLLGMGAFFPAAVAPDSKRDAEWMRQQRGKVA